MYLDYLRRLTDLLALEYNCTPDDFMKDENVLTTPVLKEGRRHYASVMYFFHMVTLGGNAVVTANECMHGFLLDYIKAKRGHWLFELPNLLPIHEELQKHGYRLSQTMHMFLPERRVEPARDFPVKWFYDSEIDGFYGDARFPNAICEKRLPERPDRIVVCAYDGDKIMGMAGCSEDAPHWQQIGIDVMPEYRSRGVGTYLVTLLKNKIAESGDVPFYGTAVANYHSWNIALNCGFRPTWVEIGAKKCE